MDSARRNSAYAAVDRFVSSGMLIGLGTGRTAAMAVERIGQKLSTLELQNIRAIATSLETEKLAISCGIPLISLDEDCNIDVAIDGADEVDKDLNLIKGRGGALLREKMIEKHAKALIVIVDEAKLATGGLGMLGPLPVEVTKFCYKHIMKELKEIKSLKENCNVEMRFNEDNTLYETVNQNYIVNISCKKPIDNPLLLSEEILQIVGVVEHGLFLNMAKNVLVGMKNGEVEDASRLFNSRF